MLFIISVLLFLIIIMDAEKHITIIVTQIIIPGNNWLAISIYSIIR